MSNDPNEMLRKRWGAELCERFGLSVPEPHLGKPRGLENYLRQHEEQSARKGSALERLAQRTRREREAKEREAKQREMRRLAAVADAKKSESQSTLADYAHGHRSAN